jgi:polyphosphate kinase
MLESIGAQVLYGVVGLKTHAKMMLITRREAGKIVRYAHLSTGNYNPGTARLYTDISHLTADRQLTADVDHVFVHLTGQNRLPRLNRLLLAPLQLHRKLMEKIQALGEASKAGQSTRLVAKMNALTDEPLIHALIDAGRAGVKIDLIVRGACMLPAQVPGYTENIRVRSVVGRFLEHSRVFYFQANDTQSLYLSSADWMNRNMMRRVELAWPVTDPVLRQRVLQECLDVYLQDQTNAWELQPNGQYTRVSGFNRKNAISAQATLMKRYAAKDANKPK